MTPLVIAILLFGLLACAGWGLYWRERLGTRRMREQALAQSGLMRKVLDVIPEPVLVKDSQYRLLMVNRAYAERAGLPAAELLGKTTHEFMPPELADRLVTADAAVFDTEQDQVFELNLPNRARNSVRSYIVSKRFARDAAGEPVIVGIHTDVTELRRVIAEFAAVIEQTPLVAVQGFDRNCVVTHWNKASEDLFGFTAAQAIGSRIQDMLLEPRQQHVFERVVEAAWGGHRAFGPQEVHLRLPGGHRLALLLTIFPVVVEGVVLELFGMAIDVSARNAAERQLAMHRDNLQALVANRTAGLLRAKQDLEQALQVRSEFLANMSHELRTPMHAVLSFARLGEERADQGVPDKLREYFARIAQSGERLLGLINNLLDLAKLEAGKMVLDREEINLVVLVHEVAAELEPLLEKKNLMLTLPSHDVPVVLSLDAAKVRQVIANLFSNAIRFSPPSGCITITAAYAQMQIGRRAGDSIESPAAKLVVNDEGPGIPAGELELIFDKFMQSSSTRTGAGGTGLGLAICREITLAHQGSIAARNRPEGGAAFELLLPCRVDAPGND